MSEQRAKYGNRKTEYAGQLYDSVLEADVARTLDMLFVAHEVFYYERQVSLELAPKRPGGRRAVRYVADFAVWLSAKAMPGNNEAIIIEAKGYETPASKLKRRWLYEVHGAEVHVVRSAQEAVDVIRRVRAEHEGRQR